MIAFDDGTETSRTLDGKVVTKINANLTANADTTKSTRLKRNANLGFIGDVKSGRFDISEIEALELLAIPNPHGLPNSNVIVPWINSLDVLRRDRNVWIIDFGTDTPHEKSALYQEPYQIVVERVKPDRDKVKRARYREWWWLHAEPCTVMRKAIARIPRFLVTPTVAKHRIFAWWSGATLPDHQVVVYARSDDLFFGILHSRFHEIWALAQGTQLREKESGFRYTPSTCFETFPFPLGVIEMVDPLPATHAAIAAAAKELNELRENWLNPPEWTREEITEFPGTVGGPWDRFIDPATITDRGEFKVGTVRYPRLVPRDAASAARLKERTLTKLYNVRPAWLAACHAKLDAAVAAAYGWPADLTEEAILERLLALNQAAAT
jgi:hypothetical protein